MSQNNGFGEPAPPPQYSAPGTPVSPQEPLDQAIPADYGQAGSVVPSSSGDLEAWGEVPVSSPYGEPASGPAGVPGDEADGVQGFATPPAPTYLGDGPGEVGYGVGPGAPYGAPEPSMSPQASPYGLGATPYPMGTYAALGNTQSNGVGTAAMICGVLGFFTCPVVLPIVAIICGGLSISAANQGRANNKGQGIAGMVLGIMSLLITAGWVVVVVSQLSS